MVLLTEVIRTLIALCDTNINPGYLISFKISNISFFNLDRPYRYLVQEIVIILSTTTLRMNMSFN